MLNHPGKLFRILLLIVLIICTKAVTAQVDTVEEQIEQTPWQTLELSQSVVCKYYHFDNLFNSKQSISIIDVNLNYKDIRVVIPYVDTGFVKTSDFASREGALAAVNGSFFDTKKGGSVVTFYKKGNLLDSTSRDFPDYRDNAGFSIDSTGKISIIKKPDNGWVGISDPYTLLASGPLLIKNSIPVDQVKEKFNTNRHPRTAIGLTESNHLIAVTVDGRSSEAFGMTTMELRELMVALKCSDAMNLDGGGSTTMWVRKRFLEGVVNFPSDNKTFDHYGERGVANAILMTVD